MGDFTVYRTVTWWVGDRKPAGATRHSSRGQLTWEYKYFRPPGRVRRYQAGVFNLAHVPYPEEVLTSGFEAPLPTCYLGRPALWTPHRWPFVAPLPTPRLPVLRDHVRLLAARSSRAYLPLVVWAVRPPKPRRRPA